MAKSETSNHDSWVRKFGKVGMWTGKMVLKGTVPSIVGTATDSMDALRESRDFVSKTKNRVNIQLRTIQNNFVGKNAKQVMTEAYNDMQNGTFSLGKLLGKNEDTIDDFDTSIEETEMDIDYNDPSSVAMGESKKNTAILGRTIAQGASATLEGLQHATKTLANIQIKSAEASTAKMMNITLMGINQTTHQLMGVNRRLDVINENLVNMINFQNNNIAAANQQAMEYYEKNTEMMNKLGEAVTSIQDYIKQQKEITKPKKETERFDFSNGFDLSTYKDMVKHNFKNSSLGMMFGFAKMGMSMMSMIGGMGGGSPLEMIEEFAPNIITSALMPKRLKESAKNLDKTFNKTINNLLYRLGDYGESGGFFSALGEIFGKKRAKIGNIKLGDFKKDLMGWNGIAQKTLVEVIPDYLARIESAITKQEARFYNMDTGMFERESMIKESIQNKINDTFEYGMSGSTQALKELFQRNNFNEGDTTAVQELISELASNQVTNKKAKRQEFSQGVYDVLTMMGVAQTEIRQVEEILMDEMEEVVGNCNRAINDLNNAQRHIFNEKTGKNSYKNQDIFKRNYNMFSGREFLEGGIALDSLSEEEHQEQRRLLHRHGIKKTFGDIKDGKFHIFKDNAATNKIADFFDSIANRMFNSSMGIRPDTSSSNSNHLHHADANSQHTDLDAILNMTESQMNNNQSQTEAVMEELERNDTPGDDSRSLKAMVLSLHHNVLSPFIGGIFGREGFIRKKIFGNDFMKGLRKKLFDEKEGIFGGLTAKFKDGIDYIKYAFTGKGYTDRENKHHPDTLDSVMERFSKGYDFVFSNMMKKFFGEDYKEKDTYKKYFSWADWRGKRIKKREKKQQEATEGQALASGSRGLPRALNNALLSEYGQPETTVYPDGTYEVTNEPTLSNLPKGTVIYNEKQTRKLFKGKAFAEGTGDSIENEEEKDETLERDVIQDIKSRMGSIFPRLLTGGVAGAILGGSMKLHGHGILGAMLGPAGPIGGAVLGVGVSILAKNKAFNEFLFGKEGEDGIKRGGLVSQKTQDFFKKNAPMIVGGAGLGLLKSVLGGAFHMKSGFLVGSLLPGGPIGGALLGMGLGILRSSETFQRFLHGEKGEDGKRSGGFFSKEKIQKIFEKNGHFFKGGLKGLGIGVGSGLIMSKMGFLGSALSLGGPVGMGLLGLGIGIASQTDKFKELLFGTEEFDDDGNSLGRKKDGIVHKLRNMLVTDVFEPIKDNLVRKTADFAFWLRKNIVKPFKLTFGSLIDSFKGIKKDISDAIHSAFNNLAETVGNIVKDAMKIALDPFKKVMTITGKVLSNTAFFGAKVALSPLSAGLKILALTTRKRRKKTQGEERDAIKESWSRIYGSAKEKWTEEFEADDRDYGKGPLGWLNKQLTHIGDRGRILNHGLNAALEGYEEGRRLQGGNTGGWMSEHRRVRSAKRELKSFLRDRDRIDAITKVSKRLRKENANGEISLSNDGMESIKREYEKAGLDPSWIRSNADLNDLVYNRDDFLARSMGAKESKIRSTDELLRSGDISIKPNADELTYYKDTKDYHKLVKKYFEEVTQLLRGMGMKDEIQKKAKESMNISDLSTMRKQLKENNLTFEDIGVRPADLLRISEFDDEAFKRYMRGEISYDDMIDEAIDKYEAEQEEAEIETVDGEVVNEEETTSQNNKGKKSKKKRKKRKKSKKNGNETPEAEMNTENPMENAFNSNGPIGMNLQFFASTAAYRENQSAQAVLEDMRDATVANLQMNVTNNANEAGTNVQETAKKMGLKAKLLGPVRWLHGKFKKKAADQVRASREAEEDEAARSGGTDTDTEKEDFKPSMGLIEWLMKTGQQQKDKGTFFGKLSGGLFSLLGGIGSFIKSAGKAAFVTYALFGDKLKPFLKEKVAPFLKDHVMPVVENIALHIKNAIMEYLPKFVSRVAKNIGDMAVTAGEKVVGAMVDLGKGAVNKLLATFGLGPLFKNIGEQEKEFDTAKEAEIEAASQNKYAHDNKILTSKQYIDEETGEIKTVGRGFGDVVSNLGRNGMKLGKHAMYYKNGVWHKKFVDWTMKGGKKFAKFAGKWTARGAAATAGGVVGVGIERTGEAVIKKGAKVATSAGKKAAEIASTAAAENKGIVAKLMKLLSTAKEKILGSSSVVSKWISDSKFKKMVVALFDKAFNFLKKHQNGKILGPLYTKITKKVGEGVGKTAATATVVIPVAFAIIDAIHGAMDTAKLFGIDDDDVTPGMRTISAVLTALLGCPIGVWVDILATILEAFTGYDATQALARAMYSIWPGGARDELDRAVAKMELELAMYNKENGTNLSQSEWNDLTNKDRGIIGNLFRQVSKLTGSYDKKYGQYEKYRNDAEHQIDNYIAQKKANGDSYSAKNYVDANSNVSYGIGSGRFFGPMSNQGDPRWANYPLGKFPDGSTSTMATGGCGPTALSMVSEQLGSGLSPLAMASYAKKNGYLQDGGSTSDLFTKGASKIGMKANEISKGSVKSQLQSGNPLILSGKSDGSGPYTQAGHVVMASGIDKNGNAIVSDPMRGNRSIDIGTLTSGMTHGWSYQNGSVYGPGSLNVFEQAEQKKKEEEVTKEFFKKANVKTGKKDDTVEVPYSMIRPRNKKEKEELTKFVKEAGERKLEEDKQTLRKNINRAKVRGPFKDAADSGVLYGLVEGKKLSNELQALMKKGTLNTEKKIIQKISFGYKQVKHKFNFNKKDFYRGLKAVDIAIMYEYKKDLYDDKRITTFAAMYDKMVLSGDYSLTHSITDQDVTHAHDLSYFSKSLGGHGIYQTYEYKNGFPFYQTDDNRWANFAWRGRDVAQRGGDLASLAMVASAFGDNMITPQYIYDYWLPRYNGWSNSVAGIMPSKVYADGGFNALKETQVDGQRLQVRKVDSVQSILSALQSKKPVVMTGYRYRGSIFGGYYNNNDPKTGLNDPDSFSTIVARAANGKQIAVNDPFTTLEQDSVFKVERLKDKIRGNKSVIKNAYVITDPQGGGIEGRVDLSKKNGGVSDYVDPSEQKGLGKISAAIQNLVAIGNHIINGFIDGTGYRSIKSINEFDEVGPDEIGIGKPAYGSNTTSSDTKSKTSEEVFNEKLDEEKKKAKKRDGANKEDSAVINASAQYNADPSNPVVPINEDEAKIAAEGYMPQDVETLYPELKGLAFGRGMRKNRFYGIGTGNTDFDESQYTASERMAAIGSAMVAKAFGDDYTTAKIDYLKSLRSNGSEETTDTSSGTPSAVLSTGSDDASYIWNELIKNNATPAGASGVMGNFEKESGNRAIRMQGDYKTPDPEKTSMEYTQRADADPNTFVHDSKGYGLAQWTYYTRKQGLVDLAKSRGTSVGDTPTQVAYFMQELNNGYPNVHRIVTTTSNIAEASNAMLHEFEAPADQSKREEDERIGFSQAYYNRFAGNTTTTYGPGVLGRRRKSRAVGYGADWLGVVRAVKQAIAAQQPGYNQGRSIIINIDGVVKSVRTDCSGFVSACIAFFTGTNFATTSSGLLGSNIPVLQNAGFTQMPFPGWDQCLPGDILAVSGHTEIFAGNQGGSHMVYNCGSSNSVNNPGETRSSKPSYTVIWRPNAAGVANLNLQSMNLQATGTDGAVATEDPTAGMNGLERIIYKIAKKTEAAIADKGLRFGPGTPGGYFTKTLGGQITSGYGKRNSVFGNEYHRGIDIGAAYGSAIHSPVSGTLVTKGTDDRGYGNYAVLKDTKGLNHLFAHMDKPVGYGIGSQIPKDSVIGQVGASGKATGSHLHYEIRRNGNKYSTIDPTTYKYDSGSHIDVFNRYSDIDQNAIGAGGRDIHSELTKKLNVALDTGNIETKMDTIIEVIKEWVDQDKTSLKSVNSINTTNVSYGNGSKKSSSNSKVTPITDSSKKDYSNMTLADIHKTIAAK